MNSKLTINLNTGLLEVEGPEELVKEIYKDFKDLLLKKSSTEFSSNESNVTNETSIPDVEVKSTPHKSKKNRPVTSTKPKSTSELKVITDLNLRPSGKISLKDFIAQYPKITSMELTLAIVYYLKEILQVEKVTVNHIFTSYKEISKKIPTPLKQILINHKNSKNWIDVTDWEDIKYTIHGMNHMDHDITKG